MKNVHGQEIGVDKRIDESRSEFLGRRLTGEKSGLLAVYLEYADGNNSDDPEVDPMVWRIYEGRDIIAELETDEELLQYLNDKGE